MDGDCSVRVPIEDILLLLEKYPNGIRTEEAAQKLGMKGKTLASRLNRQVLYGGPVDRIRQRVYLENGGHYDEYRWKLRPLGDRIRPGQPHGRVLGVAARACRTQRRVRISNVTKSEKRR
jgi:hypothetical protein